MSKKITQDEFLQRFKIRYPQADITILEYTAISKPIKVKCNKCGKILTRRIARQLLNGFDCCGSKDESRIERVQHIYNSNSDYQFIKQVDKDNIIVKHLICGNEEKRNIGACLDNPFSCKYCQTAKKKNMLSISEVQKELDETFDGTISILTYNGQLEQNTYECNKCGFIWKQKQICLMQSRGCPQCDRWKSRGEKQFKKILENFDIIFKKQVRIPQLPLQSFDFGIYDSNNHLLYYVEIQGEQHFKKVGNDRFDFEKTQIRDNKKRRYCKENNIPLYEIKWFRGEFKNLDILPFMSSTTISAKESRE